MKKTGVFVFIFISLTLLCLANTLTVQPQITWTYTTINADGSIDPTTAPIARSGNNFTLTGDIENIILLERNNTILDCAKHNIQGIMGPLPIQVGFDYVTDTSTNITIVNAVINNGAGILWYGSLANGFIANNTLNNSSYGINLGARTSQLIIYGNRVANTTYLSDIMAVDSVILGNTILGGQHPGIEGGYSNVIVGNYIMGINGSAIAFGMSSDNDTIVGNQIENNMYAVSTFNVVGNEEFNEPSTFYYNNFVNNTQNLYSTTIVTYVAVNFWDNSTTGNYWSDYNGTDANSDGLGDTPYFLDPYGNQDNHPLMTQVNISEILLKMLPTFNLEIPEYPLPSPFPSPTPTHSPTLTPSPTPTPSPSPSPSPTATPSPSPSPTTSPSPTPSLEPQTKPFPTTLIIAASVTAIVVVIAGLLVYFKKRKGAQKS